MHLSAAQLSAATMQSNPAKPQAANNDTSADAFSSILKSLDKHHHTGGSQAQNRSQGVRNPITSATVAGVASSNASSNIAPTSVGVNISA